MRLTSALVRAMPVLALVVFGAIAPAFGQAEDVRSLAAGATLEREISGGESHRYRLPADTRAYVRIDLRPRGLELGLKVSGPDGGLVAEANEVSEGVGATTRAWITEASGDYEITVRSPSAASSRGTYSLRVAQWRAVAAGDAERVAAERAREEGDRLIGLGKAETSNRAIAKYEDALALSIAAGDGSGQADAHVQIGNAWLKLSDFRKALDAFEHALPLRREAQDRAGEAAVQNDIGGALVEMNEYQQGRARFEEALALQSGSRSLDTLLLNNIGATYRRAGDARRARDYYRRALAAAREIGDRRLTAVLTNNLGLTSQLVGEYQEALDLYRDALLLWRDLGDGESEGMTITNRGLVQSALGDDAQALESFRQAHELRRAAGNRFGEANALTFMGAMYLRMGERAKSLESLQEALAIDRAIGDRNSEAIGLRDLGQVHLAAGEPARALELFRESLEIGRALGNRSTTAIALQSMARSWYLQGELTTARDSYVEALALLRESGERRREGGTLLGLAQSERGLGDLTSALAHVESAIEIIELLRSRVASTDLRASFQAANQEYYQLQIDLLMQLERARPGAGNAARALQVSERARGRSLLDLLTEAQVDLRQDADPALVEKERTLITRINANDTRRRQVPATGDGPARRARLEKELGELLAVYRDVQGEIRGRSPQYAALTQPQPLDLAAIQRELDRDTLLLEYKLGAERSYVWAVGADTFASFELPPGNEIDTAARRVYELMLASAGRAVAGETLPQRSRRIARTRAEQGRAAAALGRLVLDPVGPLLGRKRLVVVSEGALQYVPFAALPEPGRAETPDAREPLIVAHEVVSLPSASVLSLLREVEGRPRGTSVAVLADPVFSADDPRLGTHGIGEEKTGTSRAGEAASLERSGRETGVGEFRRLRFSRDEALAIASAMPAGQVQRALDFRASRATATSPDLSRHRIVHFATHGLLNSAHPELSGIVLSLVDEKGRPQDGFLRLHEIYGLDLRADLVVLSACQTALGKEIKGEGLVGLTRGFMYAGAPRIVASLWNVDDRATADLMGHFYAAMSKGMRPAQALRAAQTALRADKRWAAPYYWAAFTLQGDWN